MFITLHRSGQRPLFVRAGTPWEQIPLYVLRWLGHIDQSADAEMTDEMHIMGLRASAILYDILVHGYCMLDVPTPEALERFGQPHATTAHGTNAIGRL